MDWTEIYRDAVTGKEVKIVRADPPEGVIDLSTVKPCRPIPCPGSYFPCHDEQCEMIWEEDETGWGRFTNCDCEPRAQERRDREAIDDN